jgi:hypothetical protein
MLNFGCKNVISTYFRLSAGVMVRALRYLKTLRDAPQCQFLRTACTHNPTSAEHLYCSFSSIVLGRELSPLYRCLWGHKEVRGHRHIQQATQLWQKVEIMELSRKTINSVWDTQNCAYRKMRVILKSSRCNITGSWSSLMLFNWSWCFSSVFYVTTVVNAANIANSVTNKCEINSV